MSRSVRVWLLTGWALTVVGALLWNLVFPPRGLETLWQWLAGMMAFPVGAALILTKRPGNGVGRMLFTVGTSSLIYSATYAIAVGEPSPVLAAVAGLTSGVATMCMYVGIVAVMFLLPTGETLGGWHRVVYRTLWVATCAFTVMFLLSPGSNLEFGRANPFAILPGPADRIVEARLGVLLAFAVSGIVSLGARWRTADPVTKAQLRWFLAASLLFAVTLVAILVVGDDEGTGFIVASLLAILGYWAIPAALAIAILRYRLFEIDRLISRSVSYAVVVTLLAGVFAAIAAGLPLMLGVADDSPVLVATATLTTAVLFAPLRRRVQTSVDRHFNRARYDSSLEVDRFASRLQSHVNIDDLGEDLTAVVTKALQPSAVAFWWRAKGEAPTVTGSGIFN